MKKSRLIIASIVGVLIILVLALYGVTTFSQAYIIFIGLFFIIYLLLNKKIFKHNIKSAVTRAKKSGKLPFEPSTCLEFHEDKLVAISPKKTIEQSYDVMERICVVDNRFVLLYTSSMTANIIPMGQLLRQVSYQEFLQFLSAKCPKVEHY